MRRTSSAEWPWRESHIETRDHGNEPADVLERQLLADLREGLLEDAGLDGLLAAFNAANELAVRKFLQKKISFLDIYEIIGQSMSRHTAVADPDLDQILEIEKETYQWIESRW